jgi:DNA-binding response OmpR family regulator
LQPRVLIFEDNDILRSTLKYILNERGYEVFTFADPKMCQIFESVDRYCPADHACADIIISDVNMPTGNGLEFIKELHQKGCKVKYQALMSADWTDSDLRYAHELGCHIFHKPFNIKEMLKWLDDCAEKINSERKLSDLFPKSD